MAIVYIVLSILLSVHWLRGADNIDLVGLQSHVLHLEETVSNLQSQAQIQEQKQAAVLSSVLSELSNLKSELSTVKDRIKTNEIKINDTTSDLESCKANLTTVQSDVTTVQSDVTTLQSDVSGMKTDLNTSEESLDTLRDEVLTQNFNIQLIDRNQSRTTAQMPLLKSELQAVKANITDIKSDVAITENVTMNLTSDLSAIVTQLSANVSEVHQLCEETFESLQKLSNSLRRERSRVFFSATLTIHPNVTYQSGSRIKFQLSKGEGYDNTTGIYTVPVSGTYLFWINAIIVGKKQQPLVYIQGRGRSLGIGFGSTGSEEPFGVLTGMTMADFHKGEQVWFNSSKTTTFWIGSSFGGVLLHIHDE